jgi:hypothetical protein
MFSSNEQYSIAMPRIQALEDLRPIADYCGNAEKTDSYWRCNCPICGHHGFTVAHGTKIPILIKCWHCESSGQNDGFSKQFTRLVEEGLIESKRAEQHISAADKAKAAEQFAKEKEQRNAKRRAAIARVWPDRFEPITADTCAGKYLRARGLEGFIGHPALRCTRFQLVARVGHVKYGLTAIQKTLLLADGSDRDRAMDPGRKTIGPRSGGAVWIGPYYPDAEFVVAEGLETMLSAMILLKLRCGAAVLGSNLAGLVLPSGARRVHIAADNDGGKGKEFANCAAELWPRCGLNVRVSIPEGVKDFNDVLLRRLA